MPKNTPSIESLKTELAFYKNAVRPIEDAIQALPVDAIRTDDQYRDLLAQLHYAFEMAAIREIQIRKLELQAKKPKRSLASILNRK
jgi:hypothetical protein